MKGERRKGVKRKKVRVLGLFVHFRSLGCKRLAPNRTLDPVDEPGISLSASDPNR